MRKLMLGFFLLSVFPSARPFAQPLVGTWVSTEPLLTSLKFSLTFDESTYIITDSLGQTLGTYYITPGKIHFTPTKVGINAGRIGDNDTWDYTFTDNDSFSMSSGLVRIRMVRVGSNDWTQAQRNQSTVMHR